MFLPVADSIDRFDSARETITEPTIRKNFPESFIWEDLEGYDENHHQNYVFFFWLCGCFLSVVLFVRERMQIKTRQNFADDSHHIPMMMKGAAVADGVARPVAVNFRGNDAATTGLADALEMKIRTNFPESWIYETLDNLGSVEI
jgi:hypothetical protein